MIHTMQNLTAGRIAGSHCELCGRVDPVTDDGYTACCNELVCWGDAGGFVTVIERGGRPVAAVAGACCGYAVDEAVSAAGIEWDSSHQDCNDPSCSTHVRSRRI